MKLREEMKRAETIKKLQVLFKRLRRDLKKPIDEKKCNNYVQDLEEIKNSLEDLGYDWIEKFEDIEEVSGRWWSDEDAPEEKIQDAIKEVHTQSERLLEKLGMDPEDVLASKKEAPALINFSPTLSQHQATQVSTDVSVQIEGLVDDFKREIKKPKPDKSRLKSIMEKVLKYGKQLAPKILEIIINNINKL